MPSDRSHRPVVVDANVLFSAILRDGATRHLLLFGALDLHTPATIWEEFERNRAYLFRKSGAPPAAFDLLLATLKDRVSEVPLEVLRPHLDAARARLDPQDRLDAPYVAAAMAVEGVLWSQDRRLGRRAGVRVVTTAELAAPIGRR